MSIDRRSAVAALATLPLTRSLPRSLFVQPHGAAEHIAVIGAGAFGGWTALHLRRAGHRVTRVDAYGAGNSRAFRVERTGMRPRNRKPMLPPTSARAARLTAPPSPV